MFLLSSSVTTQECAMKSELYPEVPYGYLVVIKTRRVGKPIIAGRVIFKMFPKIAMSGSE